MEIRIYKILKHTKVEGPGIRYCIWVQGCSRKCKGCWAKATWDKERGQVYDINPILADILNTKEIEGVTFLGGEPFEQPDALKYLAKNIQKCILYLYKVFKMKLKFRCEELELLYRDRNYRHRKMPYSIQKSYAMKCDYLECAETLQDIYARTSFHFEKYQDHYRDRKSTRLNSSHT